MLCTATKRGAFNEPRNIAIFLFRTLRRDRLQKIGSRFGIQYYSSVSSAIERGKARMARDRRLKQRVDTLVEMICSKSQG
jgi:chromosomal replication initiation ATPase DnaA